MQQDNKKLSIPAKIKSSMITNTTHIVDEVIDHYIQNREANHIMKAITKAVREIGEQKHLQINEVIVAEPIKVGLTEKIESREVKKEPGQF